MTASSMATTVTLTSNVPRPHTYLQWTTSVSCLRSLCTQCHCHGCYK